MSFFTKPNNLPGLQSWLPEQKSFLDEFPRQHHALELITSMGFNYAYHPLKDSIVFYFSDEWSHEVEQENFVLNPGKTITYLHEVKEQNQLKNSANRSTLHQVWDNLNIHLIKSGSKL